MSEQTNPRGRRPRVPRTPNKPTAPGAKPTVSQNKPATGRIAVGGSERVPQTRRSEVFARPRKNPRPRVAQPNFLPTPQAEKENAAETKETQKPPKNFKLPTYLVITLIVGMVVLIGLGQPVADWWKQNREYQAVVSQLEEAKANHQRLENELTKWNTDSYLASQARSRLGYTFAGERPYIVIDAPGNSEKNRDFKATGPARPWYLVITDSIELAQQVQPAPEKDVQPAAEEKQPQN